jgi:hypothetical protein
MCKRWQTVCGGDDCSQWVSDTETCGAPAVCSDGMQFWCAECAMESVDALSDALAEAGLSVVAIPEHGMLPITEWEHLLDDEVLDITPDWVEERWSMECRLLDAWEAQQLLNSRVEGGAA